MNYKMQKAEELLIISTKSILDLLDVLQSINEDDPANEGNDISFTDSEGNEIMLSFSFEGNKLTQSIITSAGLKLSLEVTDNDNNRQTK